VSRGRHVAPHTALVTGLWAVLTRMRRPDPARYEGPLARVVKRLSPLEKARLYAFGEFPIGLTDEEQKLLRAALPAIAGESDAAEEEFEEFVEAAYEGRRGASPREMQSLLTEIAVESSEPCITPVDIFESLPRLIADPSLYAWLRVEKEGEYSDPEGFIEVARGEYLKELSQEIQRASDLVDEGEYTRLFTDYMRQVRAYGTGEKVQHPQTGQPRDPDRKLMAEVEGHLGVQGNVDEFRRNLITKVAAWRLGNPDAALDYTTLFRDHFQALRRSFFRERRERIMVMVKDALALHSGSVQQMVQDRRAAAENLVRRMIADFHYCEGCLGRVLGYFHRHGSEVEA
jgi:predicted Ser/Thr protein kinase